MFRTACILAPLAMPTAGLRALDAVLRDVETLLADQPPPDCPDPEAFRRAGLAPAADSRSAPR